MTTLGSDPGDDGMPFAALRSAGTSFAESHDRGGSGDV
jgi:hypothetical protein